MTTLATCRIFFLTATILLLYSSCKKDDNDDRPSAFTGKPKAMVIVSGNNQQGYLNKELDDSIVIRITPDDKSDLQIYSYFFSIKGGGAFTVASVVNDEYYIKISWRLGDIHTTQRGTLLLYGNCDNIFTTTCRPIDSIVVTANVNSKQWEKVFQDNSGGTGPGNFWDMHFSDVNNGVAVGDFKTGHAITSDGGNTWQMISSARNDYYDLAFANKDIGLAIVTNNYAYFTVDGGKTFTGGAWAPPIIGDRASADYFMLSRDIIFSTGNQGIIMKSENGGLGWTKYNGFNFINRINSITCTDANTCYACGDVAKIVKTTNAGTTWVEQPVLYNHYLRKIYFLNNNFGFAGGQFGALLRTTDGGTNWTFIKTGLRFDIIEIKFFSNTEGIIVTTGGEIGKTTDGGLTWKKVVTDNYGVGDLKRAWIKDANTVFGLQWQNIFKYVL